MTRRVCVTAIWLACFALALVGEHAAAVASDNNVTASLAASSSIDFSAGGRTVRARVVPLLGSSEDEVWKAKTMEKVRQANAPWLLMHGRDYGYYATSYTYELSLGGSKSPREYPYTGPYDRGANFRPPSEWLVYFMYPSSCSYARKDGELVLRYGKHDGELPWFSTEADLWPGSMPQAWDVLRSGTPSQFPPMIACEVFIDPVSYRVVRERLTFNNWNWWHECSYQYGDDGYPVSFTVRQHTNQPSIYTTNERLEAICKVVDGFWFVSSLTRYVEDPDGSSQVERAASLRDLSVVRLR